MMVHGRMPRPGGRSGLCPKGLNRMLMPWGLRQREAHFVCHGLTSAARNARTDAGVMLRPLKILP